MDSYWHSNVLSTESISHEDRLIYILKYILQNILHTFSQNAYTSDYQGEKRPRTRSNPILGFGLL